MIISPQNMQTVFSNQSGFDPTRFSSETPVENRLSKYTTDYVVGLNTVPNTDPSPQGLKFGPAVRPPFEVELEKEKLRHFLPFISPYDALSEAVKNPIGHSSGKLSPEFSEFTTKDGIVVDKKKNNIAVMGGEDFGMGKFMEGLNERLKTPDQVQEFSTKWRQAFNQAAQSLQDSFANQEFAATAERIGTTLQSEQQKLLEAYNATARKLQQFGLI